jgi:hypothetical protein
MGYGTRFQYVLKHRPMDVTGFFRIEIHRYGLVLSNGGLVFMCLVATMIRIYDAI